MQGAMKEHAGSMRLKSDAAGMARSRRGDGSGTRDTPL